jgi:hypothetical protein
MRKSIVPLIALAALAGCGPPQRDQPKAPQPPSGVTLKVMGMNEKERNIVFIRALLDSDLACDGVSKSERIPDMQGVPYWKVYCVNGSSHLITVTADGTAKIMSHS